MVLATFQEVKKWLNMDFDEAEKDVVTMADGIEGYLAIGTGLDLSTLKETNFFMYSIARNYLQIKLWLQYYKPSDSSADRLENTAQELINQLKCLALAVR